MGQPASPRDCLASRRRRQQSWRLSAHSPDEEHGEVPKAFGVLKGQATPEELMAWVAERVAAYKKLLRLEIVAEIPRTPAGKLLRRVLVERERAAVAR